MMRSAYIESDRANARQPEKSVIFITHHYDKLEKFDKVYLVKDGFLTEVRTGKM